MKYLIIFLSALFVISCGGESLEEKNKKIELENNRIENIKISTCSVLKETTEGQSAFRVKELNSARASIGLEPFVEGDKVIQNAIKFGLCESLVGNDADFKSKFEIALNIALKKEKDEFIVNACNALDMSYVKDRGPFDDEDYYQFLLWRGYSDEKYIDYINKQKLKKLNTYISELELPSYNVTTSENGSVILSDAVNSYYPPGLDSIKFVTLLHYLGLCEYFLSNNIDFVKKRLSAFDKLLYKDGNIDSNFADVNTSYVTSNNVVYFRSNYKNNPELYYYINLDTFEEYSNLEFKGVQYEYKYDAPLYSKKEFKLEKNLLIYDFSLYKNGNKKRVVTFNDKNAILDETDFYESGQIAQIFSYQNGQIKSKEIYHPDGELKLSIIDIDKDYELHIESGGWKGCREKTIFNEIVDMKFCE